MGPSPGSGESALGIEENPRRDVEAGAKRESQHGRAPASASGAETSTRPSSITHLVAVPRPIQRLYLGLRLLHRHHGSTADVLRFVLYGIRQAASAVVQRDGASSGRVGGSAGAQSLSSA